MENVPVTAPPMQISGYEVSENFYIYRLFQFVILNSDDDL